MSRSALLADAESDLSTASTAVPRVIVVVPTYDEAGNVGELADRVLDSMPGIELLVVDDDSPDGTGAIADGIATAEPRFHVVHRFANKGYARSLHEGLMWCRDRGYDFVLTMDGDLSHDPANIPELLRHACGGADLVIGSRYVDGGSIKAEWGPIRRAISQGGSRYARAMIGTPVHDCTSGYRCYSANAIEVLRLEDLHSEGYSFLIEILAQLTWAGAGLTETPITYIDRQHGKSKISRRIVLEALFETTGIGVRRLVGRA